MPGFFWLSLRRMFLLLFGTLLNFLKTLSLSWLWWWWLTKFHRVVMNSLSPLCMWRRREEGGVGGWRLMCVCVQVSVFAHLSGWCVKVLVARLFLDERESSSARSNCSHMRDDNSVCRSQTTRTHTQIVCQHFLLPVFSSCASLAHHRAKGMHVKWATGFYFMHRMFAEHRVVCHVHYTAHCCAIGLGLQVAYNTEIERTAKKRYR